ncbi:Meiotic nuclear division protein 1 [Gaertneriomyces sp. JEL0708]|nr:Meiotic nuclear division protein 1 [Gaertneriomyces sp. JEL0708]
MRLTDFFYETRKRKIDDLEAELKVLKQENVDVQRGIIEAQNGRENSDHRADLLRRLLETEAARTAKLTELEQFRDCDPTLVEEKERAVETAKEAANRWTENMFALQSYCSRTFGIPAQQFNKQFSIPEEFDTIP